MADARNHDHDDEPMYCRVVPRSEHCVSRRDIDPDALQILYRLQRSGYRAYLVGGGVRDLMLGITPKDFDIATDAPPNRLKKLFRNCRIIGRRFRLAHLFYSPNKIIEVATFRASGESDAVIREGEMIRRDNVYGSPEEDALRRDITINALFYDIADFSVIDYVGGVDDLRNGIVRTITDPVKSVREDPVRLLRVIRHASRLGFGYEDETQDALISERDELLKANPTRLLEELYKDLSHGKACAFFEGLEQFGYLELLAPELADALEESEDRRGRELFQECLERLDDRVRAGREISHAVALAAFLSPIVLPVARALEARGLPRGMLPADPFREALEPVFRHLKVFRRDEEMLWHALAAWPKVAKAFRQGSIPAPLARRFYFQEAVAIFSLLEQQSPELDEFVEEVHQLPPPDPEPPRSRPRRQRRRRRDGRGGDSQRERDRGPAPERGATGKSRGRARASEGDSSGAQSDRGVPPGAAGGAPTGATGESPGGRKRSSRKRRRRRQQPR